ncbi:MAG: hypothetical protein RI931_517, partial [Actinomycetota bacterium]
MSVISTTRATTSFNEVLGRVKAAGLLKKKPSFYVIR